MPKDRYDELEAALTQIVRELITNPETDRAKFGKAAFDLLYAQFPDLTPAELDAISRAFGPTEH